MLVIFDRMVAYATANNVPLQPIEKRKELGKIIAAAYHAPGSQKPLRWIHVKEEGNNFRVMNYPTDFQPQMDAIISNFYSENPVLPTEPKKERKRIPSKRPIASSKNYTR